MSEVLSGCAVRAAIQQEKQTVLDEIMREVGRATEKFPTWPTRAIDAFAVLGEEHGELQKEVLQMTYEPHKSSPAAVRKEAIQTAAMAIRFCMSLAVYEYTPTGQHSQGPNIEGGHG